MQLIRMRYELLHLFCGRFVQLVLCHKGPGKMAEVVALSDSQLSRGPVSKLKVKSEERILQGRSGDVC